MRTLRTRRTARALCLLWVANMLPVAAFARPDGGGQVNLAQATKRTLLQFPFDATSANPPAKPDVLNLLSDVARSRLVASNAYTVVRFSKYFAPVQRLHNDQQLSDADISEPYSEDNTKAVKVAKLVGYDLVFIGSLDSYDYNAADKQATVTVSGRIIDVMTGKIVKSATLSSSSGKGGNAKEEERAMEAARDAGEKLMSQVAPMMVVNPAPTPGPARGNTTKHTSSGRHNDSALLWGLLAVGLGLGIGLSGGHGGGGGSDGPPPPPGGH